MKRRSNDHVRIGWLFVALIVSLGLLCPSSGWVSTTPPLIIRTRRTNTGGVCSRSSSSTLARHMMFDWMKNFQTPSPAKAPAPAPAPVAEEKVEEEEEAPKAAEEEPAATATPVDTAADEKKKEDKQEEEPAKAAGATVGDEAAASSPKIHKGTVSWFDNRKGYGFILPADGSENVFVHHTALVKDGFRTVGWGEEVEYQLETDPQGRSLAVHVTGPGGVQVTGKSSSTVLSPKKKRREEDKQQ